MTKEMSKRQARREQVKREKMRSRLFTIGLITVGALMVAFVFIYPNFKSIGSIATVEANPRPQADGTAMGDPNAPVRIDVFEDFQCPACSFFSAETVSLITETYVATGKVYYVFHNYPFLDANSSTKESHQAANAAMCAAEQGKFWEYHDVLFANWNGENLGAFNDRRLQAFAGTIDGLDTGAFDDCFAENRYKDDIEADFSLGERMGVNGTPSVFVNDVAVGQPGKIPQWSEIQQAVEAALTEQ